jgi:hypothetical protein
LRHLEQINPDILEGCRRASRCIKDKDILGLLELDPLLLRLSSLIEPLTYLKDISEDYLYSRFGESIKEDSEGPQGISDTLALAFMRIKLRVLQKRTQE